MSAFAYYLLKVIFCSGILYGYYHLALRNKLFHQWNRFYLLAIIPMSVLLPLLDINIIAPAPNGSRMVSVLHVVAAADEYSIGDPSAATPAAEDPSGLLLLAYSIGSLMIFFLFARALESIRQMVRRNPSVTMDEFIFLNTAEPGTPFSFFRYLLWNREISLDTESGKRILEHELVHIREKHSYDKIFIQLILVAFWINPFFWLIRREITLVHEFIADRHSVKQGDASALAKLLLETSFPGYAPLMTNSFFKTSIKRRLAMINMQNNPGLSYISRILMIPVLAILVFTFAVKAKTFDSPATASLPLDKAITVVIDAGHGGDDPGAMNGQYTEKDISLALAKKVKELNSNPRINIVLSRPGDELINPVQRAETMKKIGPDILISLHVNAAKKQDSTGIIAFIDDKNKSYAANNVRLASILLSNMNHIYPSANTIRKREKPIYILKQSAWPAVVLECGYITNPTDLAFIIREYNQEKIARQILRSIEEYFDPNVQLTRTIVDTIPQNKKLKTVTFVYADGTKETLTPEEYRKRMGKNPEKKNDSLTAGRFKVIDGYDLTLSDFKTVEGFAYSPADTASAKDNTNYFINEKISSRKEVNDLDRGQILSIDIKQAKKDGKEYVFIVTRDHPELKGKTGNVPIPPDSKINGTYNIFTGSKDSLRVNINGTGRAVTIKSDPSQPKPLYLLNDKELTEEEMKPIDPNSIESIKLLKGKAAEAVYKDKGRNGVVVITLKKGYRYYFQDNSKQQ